MARQSINATLGTSYGEGRYGSSAAGSGAMTIVADQAAVAAALATLVADGATPTQAHVTALSAAYTTLAADVAALTSADVQITWNTSKITTVTQLKRAFDAALQAAAGGGILTA